jgi:hypothetical protein
MLRALLDVRSSLKWKQHLILPDKGVALKAVENISKRACATE